MSKRGQTRNKSFLSNQLTNVALEESYGIGIALRIDKEQGIIYGCKIGGRFSKNCHGIAGVTEGTEYKATAYKNALSLYENARVYASHAGRGRPATPGPFDYLGVIRNARYDDAADCPRGDFHYRKSHPDALQLVEDVERNLDGFGFSHHIPPGGYVGKIVNGRLVIESINAIKSVDLVSEPATTRNLREDREPTVEKTFKEILESWVADKSDARKALAATLLEDDAMPDATATTSEDADPEDELWQGFLSAIMAIINGDDSAADKAKQIGKYLKAHEKLTGDKDPTPDDSGDSSAKESIDSSKETHELKAKLSCLEAGVKNPSAALLKALTSLDTEVDRKALIEQTRVATESQTPRRPMSGTPRPSTKTPNRPLTEGKVPTGDAFRRSIRD